jgi:hypothetical protein
LDPPFPKQTWLSIPSRPATNTNDPANNQEPNFNIQTTAV